MLPFLNVLILGTQYVFPAVETAKVLRSNADTSALSQWLVYWVLIVLLLVLESWLSSVFDLIPLYGELKLVGLAWLIHPEFEGASFLWHKFLKGPFKTLEELIQQHLGHVIEKLKIPDPKGDKLDKSNEEKAK